MAGQASAQDTWLDTGWCLNPSVCPWWCIGASIGAWPQDLVLSSALSALPWPRLRRQLEWNLTCLKNLNERHKINFQSEKWRRFDNAQSSQHYVMRWWWRFKGQTNPVVMYHHYYGWRRRAGDSGAGGRVSGTRPETRIVISRDDGAEHATRRPGRGTRQNLCADLRMSQ